MLRFTIAYQTTPGLRAGNEDAYLVKELNDTGLFVAVADGLGGEPHGDIASNSALAAIQKYLTRIHPDTLKKENLRKILSECFELAQYTIRQQIMDHDEFRGMATTLSAVLILEDAYVVGNIGDSRVYLVGPDYSRQLTIDHTYISEFEQNYHETVSLEFLQRYGSILTRVVNGRLDRPDLFPPGEDFLTLNEGETLLLCTDGLILDKRALKTEFISPQVRISQNLSEAASNLVGYALENGATDNITLILVRRNFIVPEPQPLPVTKSPPVPVVVPPIRTPDTKPVAEKKEPSLPESPAKPYTRIPPHPLVTRTRPADSPVAPARPVPVGRPGLYRSGAGKPEPVKGPPPDPLDIYYGKTKLPKDQPSPVKEQQPDPLPGAATGREKSSRSFQNRTLNIIGIILLIGLSALALLSIFDFHLFKKEDSQSGRRILYNGKPVVAPDGSTVVNGKSLLFAPESVNASREKYLLILSNILTQGFNFQFLKAVVADLKNIRPSYLTEIRIDTWEHLQQENLIENGTAPQAALVQPGLIVSATDSGKFLTIRYNRDTEGSTDSVDFISRSGIHFFSSGLAIIAGKYFDAAFLVRMVEKYVFYLVTYDPEGNIMENPLSFNPELGSPNLFTGSGPCSSPEPVPRFATYRNQPVIDISCKLPDARGCFRIGLPW